MRDSSISLPVADDFGCSNRLSDSDVALDTWLNLLIQVAAFYNDEDTQTILKGARSNKGSAVPDQNVTNSHQDESSTYIYKPLKPNAQEIRVLLLHPSKDPTADLYCDVFPLDLVYWKKQGVESYPYMALSYVWGDPNPPRRIFLGGRRKDVGPSLFEALQEFRDPSVPVLLWVDALCIDQSNVSEKNHQVGMMDLVYKCAGCVLIWVDDGELTANLAKIADPVFNVMNILSGWEWFLFAPYYEVGNYENEEQPVFEELLKRLGGWLNFHSIKQFFTRRHWTRVWTMQEVLLGRNPLLCHGGYAVYFRTLLFLFIRGYNWAIPQDTLNEGEHVDDSPLERLLKLRWEMENGRMPSPLTALLLSRERCATMNQDYIFGVLGMLGRDSPWKKPDYERDLFSVSRDIFQYILATEGNIDVLTACELRNHYKTDPIGKIRGQTTWPSWLPDWSIAPIDSKRVRSVLLAEEASQCKRFSTSGNTKPVVRLLEDETLLMIRGVVVDEIEVPSATEWTFSHKPEWALFSASGVSKHVYGGSIVDMKKAFDGTIALGQYISREMHGVKTTESVDHDDDNSEDQGCQVTPLDDEDTFVPGLNPSNASQIQVLNNFKCPNYISRFFITGRGYIGRGPIATEKGDKVVIFLGAKVPYALRKFPNTDQYRIVGECYVHGIMRGVLMQDISNMEIEDFTLR